MQQEVIKVVDAAIFKQELDRARILFPFAMELLKIQKYVAKFLGISEATVRAMVADGRLVEGIHYTIGTKIHFIPEAIVDYKIAPKEPTYRASDEAKTFI